MTFPTFLVIGAEKAATTSLYSYLASHPDVAVSGEKELDFFSRHWHLGSDWYESCFPADGEAKAVGEASPGYTAFPIHTGVPERIARLLPDVRLIYVVRNPIDRMRSSYRHALASGIEHRPLREAIFDPWYLLLSHYALQIELYLEFFDRSQLLIVVAEELERDPAGVTSRVFDFIGVDAAWVPPNLDERLHVTSDKRVPRRSMRFAGHVIIWTQVRLLHRTVNPASNPPAWVQRYASRPFRPDESDIDADLRATLTRLLRPDLLRLSDHIGGGFDAWGLL